MEDKRVYQQKPREDMLFWRLTGSENVIFAEGDKWRKQVNAVRRALASTPIETFVAFGPVDAVRGGSTPTGGPSAAEQDHDNSPFGNFLNELGIGAR